MCNPPVSKHNPLPTNPWNLSFYSPPLYSKQIKIGSFLLALPTACINLKPSSNSLSPLITVSFIFLYEEDILNAYARKYYGLPSFPLLLAHSADRIFALVSSRTV